MYFTYYLLQAKKILWSFNASQLIDSSSLTHNNSTVGLLCILSFQTNKSYLISNDKAWLVSPYILRQTENKWFPKHLNTWGKHKIKILPSHCNDIILFLMNSRIGIHSPYSTCALQTLSAKPGSFPASIVQILIRHLLKCVKDNKYFHKGSIWELFQKNAVCDVGALCTADPHPVVYQGKWKMLPIICECFHYKVNRIYKLSENDENNPYLLEVFLYYYDFTSIYYPIIVFLEKKQNQKLFTV